MLKWKQNAVNTWYFSRKREREGFRSFHQNSFMTNPLLWELSPKMKCLTFSIHKCHLTCKVFLVCFVLNTHLSYHFVFSKMLVCYYEVGTVDFFLIFGLFSTFKQILSMSFFHKPSLSSAHISSLRRRNHCKFKLASDQEERLDISHLGYMGGGSCD